MGSFENVRLTISSFTPRQLPISCENTGFKENVGCGVALCDGQVQDMQIGIRNPGKRPRLVLREFCLSAR